MTELNQWKIDYEAGIRQDAISRSRAVIVGKVAEHLVPYMPSLESSAKAGKGCCGIWSRGLACMESMIREVRSRQFAPDSTRQPYGFFLNLDYRELAFYDALEVNDSAVKILGDQTLRTIARELLQSVRNSTTVDWAIKESVQATLRRNVRRILR